MRHLPTPVVPEYEKIVSWGFSRDAERPYTLEFLHEIRITQDLETHHLSVSLDFS